MKLKQCETSPQCKLWRNRESVCVADIRDERWDDFAGDRPGAIMQAAKNLDAHLTEFKDFMTKHKSPRGPVAQSVP